jgi:hypothetical protein
MCEWYNRQFTTLLALTHSYTLNAVHAHTLLSCTDRKLADATTAAAAAAATSTASATEAQDKISVPTVAGRRNRRVFSPKSGGRSTRVYRSRAAKMMDGYANR